MYNESLNTLFATVAQVSFTLAGLIAIAIASDRKSREFWFTNSKNFTFIRMNFLLLIFPGFIAIGGLLPIHIKPEIPSWPIPTLVISVIYSTFSFVFLKYRNTYLELSKRNRTMFSPFGFSLLGIIVAIYGLITALYFPENILNYGEIFLGVILLGSILSGAFFAISIFREGINQGADCEVEILKEIKDQGITINQTTMSDNNRGSSTQVIFSLLLAFVAFIAGRLLKD